jgi:transcriptional regulator with XRE-family HTH domain
MGKVITDLRSAKKLSQSAFGGLVGYDGSYIGQLERGEKTMTLEVQESLARWAGMRPSQLLARAERLQIRALKERSSKPTAAYRKR